jgi:hypothetical protein
MTANRIIVAIVTLTVLCAAICLANGGGPAFGKWQFNGKDNAGVVWTGTLTIEKLDPNRFDTVKYQFMCDLEAKSANSENGVSAPGRYDQAARSLSFSTGISQTTSYTAVLSPDGKSLTEGKWTVTKKAGNTVVSSGTWSAKLAAR